MRIICSCFIYAQRLQQARDSSIKGSYWKKTFEQYCSMVVFENYQYYNYGQQHTGNLPVTINCNILPMVFLSNFSLVPQLILMRFEAFSAENNYAWGIIREKYYFRNSLGLGKPDAPRYQATLRTVMWPEACVF
jgi:hypothetical protein